MKKILFTLIIFVNFLYSKEVLLIHSYHKGYIWTDEISKTIETKFDKYQNINLTTLYMDTKRIATPEYLEELSKLYKIQLKDRNFDLIITSDDYAYEFLEKYYNDIFSKKIPILFCGFNNLEEKSLNEFKLREISSGVLEEVDVLKNFELIKKLQPNIKKLLIINDSSKTAMAVKKEIDKSIIKFNNQISEIEYLDNFNIDLVKDKVSTLPSDSAILFVLLFKDKTGKFFTHKESLKQIKEVSRVPIYALWDFYLNFGAIGGMMTSASGQGEAVAKMAIDILEYGKNIKSIPILTTSPNRYIFDYNEVKAYNIDLSKLDFKYTVVNKPFSFYKEYSDLVNATILAFTIFIILLIIMDRNIKRRKIVEKNLQNRLKFDKVLLDTIPNPIYYKNTDGKFLGFNKAFSELVGAGENDIIGKTALDFFPKDIAMKNIIIDKHILKTHGKATSDMTLNFKNHPMKHIILNKAVYDNIDGNIGGIVCVMDDITERVQQKQFIIQQAKLAEMGDMVAAIAHQWNEPLVELSAGVQDIQMSYDLNELTKEQVKEFVYDSMIQIKYMSKTLTDFRNFLKPSTKKDLFNVKETFNEIFEIIKKQIFYSNIDLIFDIEDENITIYGFKNEFSQVLLLLHR